MYYSVYELVTAWHVNTTD